MTITAYQTLEDRDNLDHVEMEGPFACTHRGSWLGSGYYFWDTNMDWAINWGKTAYESRGNEYFIGRCQLDLSKDCFDLVGNVAHWKDLLEVFDVFTKSKKIRNQEKIILPNVIQFMKNNGLFPFKSIRASDMHRNVRRIHFRNDRGEYMIINQRVQVCVIDRQEVLIRPFSIVFPEKYLL
jgi:hypothetical protein